MLLLMRPRFMQACHSTASCHLGTALTLRTVKRFYWWIGMSICIRWWLRNCLKCKARNTSWQTARWPTVTLPLPEGPGIAVIIGYLGLFPVTPRGNTTSCFSHIVSATEPSRTLSQRQSSLLRARLTFSSTGKFPLWGCPRITPSDNGLQFSSKLSHAV